jgi:hypothetical protein
MNREQRRLATDRSLAYTRDLRRFVSGWFQFTPFDAIYVENAKEWVAWSMFGIPIESVPDENREEIAGYVAEFETHAGSKFPEGYNENLKDGSACIRINIDGVSARHRPLLSYGVTYTAHGVGWVILKKMGFVHAQAGELTYWYRTPPGSSDGAVCKAPPVVLLHGIGLGLVPYVAMLKRLKNSHGDTSTLICPVSP